jgi:hypothetical protein
MHNTQWAAAGFITNNMTGDELLGPCSVTVSRVSRRLPACLSAHCVGPQEDAVASEASPVEGRVSTLGTLTHAPAILTGQIKEDLLGAVYVWENYYCFAFMS